MDVEGLRANGPGDKTKVFGMQEGQDDFITNKFRVDIQYRGTTGFPPNAITFRALNGDRDDLDVRYEPDTATRMASVFLLNPANVYHWKATWGSEFRVTVRDGGTIRHHVLQHRRRRHSMATTRRARITRISARRSAAAAASRQASPARSTATSG